MNKFNIGDIIIGNKKANHYGITVEGWKGKVTAIYPVSDAFEAISLSNGNSYYLDDYESFDLIEDKFSKENNMKILEIYEERKEKILYKNYKEKIKEIESFDSIQGLLNDAQDQLNTLLGRTDDNKVTISVNNLKGDKLHDEITQVKIEEAKLNFDKQNFELNSLIEEVQALLEMTSDYNEQIKILKKYDILNKEGKLNV